MKIYQPSQMVNYIDSEFKRNTYSKIDFSVKETMYIPKNTMD